MAVVCKHCVVSGRVQGVYYRASTEKEAIKLGLSGWVRNLDNGDVEATLQGEEELVSKMLEWMHKGPIMAKVEKVVVKELEEKQSLKEFLVRY